VWEDETIFRSPHEGSIWYSGRFFPYERLLIHFSPNLGMPSMSFQYPSQEDSADVEKGFEYYSQQLSYHSEIILLSLL